MVTATVTSPFAAAGVSRSRSRGQPLIGWMLIIPLMFFACGGTPSFDDTGVSGSSLSGLASTGHHLGLFGYVVLPGIALGIVLWLVLINSKRIISLALEMKMLTLLALLTICSALWSQDPFRSSLNGVLYLIETLFAFSLVLKWDHDELCSLVVKAGLSVSALSLILIFLFPQVAVVHGPYHTGAWNGVFADRTMAGKCLVFLISPAILFQRRSFRYRNMIYIALMSLMIFMAYAMTARMVLLAYIIFMAYIRIISRSGQRSALLMSGIFVMVAVSIACIGMLYMPLVLEGIGRNATLTGRTGIWSSLLLSVAKRPLLGYGFYAFWLGMTGESARVIVGTHWAFGYAHNGILEIWLQLGLVGTALFFVTLFQAIGNAWFCLRTSCTTGVEWYIGLIALTVMYNVDESSVLWPKDLSSVLYIVACCGLAMAVRRIKLKRKIEALSSNGANLSLT